MFIPYTHATICQDVHHTNQPIYNGEEGGLQCS
jgi:hypothetical protein